MNFSSLPLRYSYVDYSLRITELEDIELGKAMVVISRIENKRANETYREGKWSGWTKAQRY